MRRVWPIGITACSALWILHCGVDDFRAEGAGDAGGDASVDATSGSEGGGIDSGGGGDGGADAEGGAKTCVDTFFPNDDCANENGNCATAVAISSVDAGVGGGVFGLSIDATSVFWVSAGARDPTTPGVIMQASRAGGGGVPLTGTITRPVMTTSDATYVYWLDEGASPPSTVSVGRTLDGHACTVCGAIAVGSIDAARAVLAAGPQDFYFVADSNVAHFVPTGTGAWNQSPTHVVAQESVATVGFEGLYASGAAHGIELFTSAGAWNATWAPSPSVDAGGNGGVSSMTSDCAAVYVASNNNIYRYPKANPTAPPTLLASAVLDTYSLAVDSKWLYAGRENGGGVMRMSKSAYTAVPRQLLSGVNARSIVVGDDGVYVGANGDGMVYKLVK